MSASAQCAGRGGVLQRRVGRAEVQRTLLEGCGNPVLLETFDRLWTASELVRRWAAHRNPGRDPIAEHRQLEEAAQGT